MDFVRLFDPGRLAPIVKISYPTPPNLKSYWRVIGILEYETKELLSQHITKDVCYSLDYLNQQITSTKLGYVESRNRPSLISLNTLRSNDHKLKQDGVFRSPQGYMQEYIYESCTIELHTCQECCGGTVMCACGVMSRVLCMWWDCYNYVCTMLRVLWWDVHCYIVVLCIYTVACGIMSRGLLFVYMGTEVHAVFCER